MKVTFLGQGLKSESENAIGKHLIKYLRSNNFYSFTAISAFVSKFAIEGLAQEIEKVKGIFNKLTIIVGIDQEGTSKEALEEILNLNINSYIFYQSESAIFHPKIYLFEGTKEIKLIIGSSNLTGNGLFVNVESSVLIEFTNDNDDGKKLINNLKEYYKNLLDFSDANLFKITKDVIEKFSLKGILPDESTRKRIYSKISETENVNDSTKIEIPKRLISKIPYTFKQIIESEGVALNIDMKHLIKNIPNEIKLLFNTLKNYILKLGNDISINVTPNYVGFTTSQIFAEVRLQKKNIRIVLLTVDYSEFVDDVTIIPSSYGWGNKTIKIYINSKDALIRMMPLIEKSYYRTK